MAENLLIIGCCILSVVIRWAVSLFPYSGYRTPPMFGDYEAQRHWMEITYHLKPTQWYHNGTQNDLQYWGLDYPPLTAYHSWIMGYIVNKINPSWVPLNASLFTELTQTDTIFHNAHKLFMRYSVLVVDMLVYIPAVIVFHMKFDKSVAKSENQCLSILISLLYPGLVLIDHGHFQYNCVSLGLALWAVIFIGKGCDCVASIAFSLALNYKQMELYHALPFFFYLLGQCWKKPTNFKAASKLASIGFVVIATFIVCWFPFVKDFDKDQIFQVVHRLFPFKRGIFEDKVSNVWCSLTALPMPFKKIKEIPVNYMSLISLITTLIFTLPSSIHLLKYPTFRNFKISLINISLVFYLFSFQVHEKSILLATLPVCLLLPEEPLMCGWFLLISTVSMFPLLLRDLLSIPCLSLQLLFLILIHLRYGEKLYNKVNLSSVLYEIYIDKFFLPSLLISFVLCLLCQFQPPPDKLPDLWPVLISLYCCAHFLMFAFYFHGVQFTKSEERKKKL